MYWQAPFIEQYGNGLRYNSPYINIKNPCPEDPKRRTWEKLLGDNLPAPTVMMDKKQNILTCVMRKEAVEALKKMGCSLMKTAQEKKGSETEKEKEDKREQEAREKAAEQALQAVIAATPGKKYDNGFWRVLLVLLFGGDNENGNLGAVLVRHGYYKSQDEFDDAEYGHEIDPVLSSDGEKIRSIIIETLAVRASEEWANQWSDDYDRVAMAKLCRYYGVDIDAIMSDVKKQLTAASKEKKEPAKKSGNKK